MNVKLTRSRDSGRLLKLDTSDAKHEYKSGASYCGSLKEKKRSGRGVFRWPNGACYKGDFVDNRRHGEGIQEWPDGSSYIGNFQNDIREGRGRHTWCNGEVYEGDFLSDRRHGKGIYFWPGGTKYEGYFHDDLKDGFGIFTFHDGKKFEGLYKNNERNGPGILSYGDGRQDVGIWQGEKLIKLCAVMENAFLFQHFPDYYVNAGENLPVKVRRANSALADARNVVGRQEIKNFQTCYGTLEERSEVPVTSQVPSSFPYTDILDGVRSPLHSRPKGPCEVASEQFLRAAGEGDCIRVTELLEEGLVHVDVADKTGFTSLLAASVNCHKDVINCLLDYGADVNKLNCEGLSALAACHVLFYTKHTWKDNIAETLEDENLFNSVQWDIPSGTFVQRRIQARVCNIKVQVSESQSVPRLEKENETSQTTLVDSFSHLKTGDRKSSNVRDNQTSCFMKKNSNNQKEFSSCLEYSGSEFKVEAESGNSKNEGYEEISGNKEGNRTSKDDENRNNQRDIEPEDKRNGMGKGDTGNDKNEEFVRSSHNALVSGNFDPLSSTVKRSNARNLNQVDKNMFIQEFLSRTVSAMSNNNFSVSYENMETSLENSYLDYRTVVITGTLNEQNNCNEEKDSCLDLAVNSRNYQDSIHYSVQNAIGSSLHTSTNTDDADSLNSVEQKRQKLLTQQRRPHLEATVRLLLKRGADPNSSSLPMPVLFFAIKAADTAAVEILLEKGASTNARLSVEKLGITPLHIAVALPSDAVTITELLLKAGADPNIRDFAFGKKEGGRTPAHTVCCREDNDEEANRVISLLLNYKADPDLLCKGHSALSLAIGSGNDMAVETLLKHHASPSLPLPHGVGSALCATVSFTAERRRKIVDRIRLVNKLIRNEANILAPIVVSNEHPPGTVVDYAYCVFYQDRRIAHTPYHALTSSEREIYIARRRMLDHLAELLRTHVLKKEKKLLEEQLARAKVSQDESPGNMDQATFDRTVSFYFNTSEKELRDRALDSSLEKVSLTEDNMSSFLSSDTRLPDCGLRVAVVQTPSDHMNVSRLSMNSSKKRQLVRKNRFRYCYECGRSVGVRLSACTRCKEVFYCSRSCKLKAWNSRHKEECIRLSGTNKSNLSRKADSPTPVTNPDKDNSLFKNSRDFNIKEQYCRNRSHVSKETSIKKSLSGHASKSVISH